MGVCVCVCVWVGGWLNGVGVKCWVRAPQEKQLHTLNEAHPHMVCAHKWGPWSSPHLCGGRAAVARLHGQRHPKESGT